MKCAQKYCDRNDACLFCLSYRCSLVWSAIFYSRLYSYWNVRLLSQWATGHMNNTFSPKLYFVCLIDGPFRILFARARDYRFNFICKISKRNSRIGSETTAHDIDIVKFIKCMLVSIESMTCSVSWLHSSCCGEHDWEKSVPFHS